MKHSPGPWEVADGQFIRAWRDGHPVAVAFVKSDNADADTRLIAAAPEMLELLREFVAAWDKFVRDNPQLQDGDGVIEEDPFAVKARRFLLRLDGDS